MNKYYTKKDIAKITRCTIRTVNTKLKDYPIKYFGKNSRPLVWANDFHAVMLYGKPFVDCTSIERDMVREAVKEA